MASSTCLTWSFWLRTIGRRARLSGSDLFIDMLLERSMKSLTALVLAALFTLAIVVNVNAQSTESIWLTANTTAYKTGETVIATVNATSATPMQGFTFQIRYDPECLQPLNAVSTVPGMNALPLPQIAGLADGSYASTTPQTVNGVLAEVRFVALKGCQTNLTLETAALAVRNESGFAAPLSGVTIGEKNVALNIDKALGVPQPTQPASSSTLSLVPTPSSDQPVSVWMISLLAAAFIVIAGVSLAVYRLLQPGPDAPARKPVPSRGAVLYVKRGPYAGKSFALNRLPC